MGRPRLVARDRVALITAGDPARRTGGYLYNSHVLGALAHSGDVTGVEQIVLPDDLSRTTVNALRSRLSVLQPAVVIIDSIVFPSVATIIDTIQHDLGTRVLALMHMVPADPIKEGPEASAGEAVTNAGLQRRWLALADQIVAVSPSLREQLIDAGAPPDRFVVILPGRDGCSTIPPPPSHHVSASGVRFLTVANWSDHKGIHRVVQALARLDPVTSLDLAGEPGDGEYARQVRGLIARHELNARVRVHGSLAADALGQLYAASDVFVLPSRSEGFGIVYAEAMHFGKPVIAGRVGPLPWLVEAGCGLLVPPDDVVALASAMRLLATDDGLRQHLGVNARRRAARLPTWRESEKAFREVIKDLLQT